MAVPQPWDAGKTNFGDSGCGKDRQHQAVGSKYLKKKLCWIRFANYFQPLNTQEKISGCIDNDGKMPQMQQYDKC